MFTTLVVSQCSTKHMVDADWIYQKRKQRLQVCTYPTCQLDLGVKYHLNKEILN